MEPAHKKLASPPGLRMSRGKIADVPENFIRIGNKLYDAKKIEAWHPGGKIFIQGPLAFILFWHASIMYRTKKNSFS